MVSRPNILLVILDSLRARNCSLHGYDRETTPYLSDLADSAVVYEQARAPSIHSISSHASIFTGRHVTEHGITEHKSFVKPEATVWNRLRTDHGYETGLFTPNVIVTQTSNLGTVFDTCVGPKRAKFRLFEGGLAPLDIQGKTTSREYLRAALRHEAPVRSVLNGMYKKLESRGGSHDPETEDASVYTGELLDWVEARSGPWAACLNLMDTHTPFAPSSEFDRWSDERARAARRRVESGDEPEPFSDEFWDHLAALEPLYDGTIRRADAAIEGLVDALDAADELEDTLLVVTSDHGEAFGERSALAPEVRLRHHSWGIDEVLTHVPLVVRPPGGCAGTRIRRPATLTQFPDVVMRAVEGADSAGAASGFVPDGDVVASTFRIVPPGDELDLPASEREQYFGPWEAVYRPAETEDVDSAEPGSVVKYARRGTQSATFVVPDARTVEKRGDSDEGVVESVFSTFTDAGVKLGAASEREVTDDVEDRLSDLGYLR
jgi:arylsulfatase A-like enzyme